MASLLALIDNAGLRSELGISEHAAWKIMRAVGVIRPRGVRRVYVRREDVRRHLGLHYLEHDDREEA